MSGTRRPCLSRRGAELFAIGATCTHYGGPLAEGLVVGDTIRCPWHHACFSLRTGEALRAPALNPLACWHVEQRDGMVFVREKPRPTAAPTPPADRGAPDSVVIVGGGAAGHAAAEMLRREGYRRPDHDAERRRAPPVRPPEPLEGLPRRRRARGVDPAAAAGVLRRAAHRAASSARASPRSTPAARQVALADGSRHAYGALLLATGAEPVRLTIPGADLPHVHDAAHARRQPRASSPAPSTAERAVVIGASFIGLEVAASLRARGHRGPRRRARGPPARAHPRPRARRLHPRAPRRARRRLPPRRTPRVRSTRAASRSTTASG